MNQIVQIDACKKIAFYFQKQDFASLTKLFNSALTLKTVPAEIALMYAVALRKENKLSDSASVFQKIIKLHPKHIQIKNSFGNLLLQMAKTDLAINQFVAAISLNPQFADGYLNCGRAYMALEQYSKARQYYTQAVRLRPADTNSLIGLAEAEASVNNLTVAEKIYTDVLNLQPDNIKALNNFGNIKRRQGNVAEAITLLERASQFGSATILKNLAACYALNKQISEAEQSYQQALHIAPDDISVHEEYASLLWQKGDASPFRFLEGRLIDPAKNPGLWVAYVRMLLRIDKPQRAEHYMQLLIAETPNDPTLLTLAATVQRDSGKLDESVTLARKALKCSRGNQTIPQRSELAYSLLAKKNGTEAAKLFQSLCRDDPKNQGWWTTLSTAWLLNAEQQKYSWLCNYQLVNISQPLATADPVGVFNKQLSALLNSLHQNVREPIGQSLRHGSQTFEDIFDDNDPLLQALKQAILQQARQFISTLAPDRKHPFLSRLTDNLKFKGSWSVRLHSSGYHKSHFHPMGWLSGVYYVDVPVEVEHNGQGWLVFGRPEIPQLGYDGDYAVKPQAGLLVLFPSYMWHGTNAFKSESNRVTVAFDLIPDEDAING